MDFQKKKGKEKKKEKKEFFLHTKRNFRKKTP